MFYIDKIAGKKILKSSLLSEFEEKVTHIFTTKESVIKTEESEIKETAKLNKELILKELAIKQENLIEVKQTHSVNIITEKENIAESTNIIEDTDGVVLYTSGVATILNFADCTPVILYNPQNNVLAGLHAGWRGTAGEISKLGLGIMQEKFNVKPAETIAIIGPCIGQENFECGLEVYENLKDTVTTEVYDDRKLFKLNNNKVYPDLAGINARQLKDLGVQSIDICQFKTYKNNDLLFSYRREKGTTSRISMVLKLN